MKDASMSLGIYLEIKDAEICGGDGSIGWVATIVDIYSSDRPGIISKGRWLSIFMYLLEK